MEEKAIDRLFKYLDANNISPYNFEKKVGFSNGYLRKQQERKANLGEEKLRAIVKNVPALSLEFLLFGHNSNTKETIVSEPGPVYERSSDRGVPYYDVDFAGGFDLVYNDNTIHPSYFIDFAPFNDADCYVKLSGESMSPLISHGDLVALKQLSQWDQFILFGEIYAVVTEEFRTIKIVSAGTDHNNFTLIPYSKSPEFANQPIPKDIITHIFQVKGSIKKFF